MKVAIIPAAGKGRRMQSERNKQFLILNQRPLLSYTIDVFQKCDKVDRIIVVVNENEIDFCRESIVEKYQFDKVSSVIAGGNERQDSVMNGLREIPPETTTVIIHDGARPFVTLRIIENAIEALNGYSGVIVGVPLKDTIKRVNEKNEVLETLDRDTLISVQTPQVFPPEELMKAYQRARMDGFHGTDDALLVERIGGQIKVVNGSYENIKITTPEDIILAEAILEKRKAGTLGNRL
ncbi:MAG: 2-C-methyl-D-erythritol 4-phosphate cytidylyltransferase [Actinobacteria bacterium]|nr:2-C-methyl-D-erythritol 4-phosphate cytidylyltransferase [Actinomycetota bacterium]